MRVQRSVVASCVAFSLACGGSRVPASLRGYDILVERRDPQGEELAQALQDYGFRLRRVVRGGSRPTAALVYFTFRNPAPGEAEWMHLRLADTRSGEIVGAASIPLDSVGPAPRDRARAAVRALIASPLPAPP